MLSNDEDVVKKGCLFGCLSQDLIKVDGCFEDDCSCFFVKQFDWFEVQFWEVGKGGEVRDFVVYFFVLMQGVFVVCQVFGQFEVLS